MASSMKHSETVRKHKLKARGRWRKNRLENRGTTKSASELFKVVG
jgi:hypothetical protein